MNSAQFERLPHFIRKEMESISEKIRPLMKKVSTYYIFGLPLMLIGILNILFFLFDNGLDMESYLVPIVYAFFAALGLALFNESRLLKKEIHQVGKDYIIERINKSELMGDEEKNRYIASIKRQVKMDLQPFFKFLAEENKRNQDAFFK
ncbi:YwnF family protein [Amphibacillus sp. Q70]|uniref:YwnF family protein n=1 Tax=Amphibacillus sp. Q70 TaxID=3453416 RepID=UPI003F85F50E